jgi:uncharacterized protein (TIGR03032 family)
MSMSPAAAIDYQVTPGFLDLLGQLRCSLVISNYQSSTVMTFSRLPNGRPVQMYAAFPAAMGLAVNGDRLAIAARTEVIVLTNTRRLAPALPGFPGLFNGYFVPRLRYLTGEAELHDLAFIGEDLFGVNTAYSCICRLDGIHSFVPVWQPPFIDEIRPGDRCHLNGMALEGGAIRYATALGATNAPRAWNPGKLSGGVLLEVPTGRVLSQGLCMPHSPRLIGGRLYLTEAGTGKVVEIDRSSGERRSIATLPGFARGVAEYGGYLFVGLSLIRDKQPFEGLPLQEGGRELICGVVALHPATGEIVGYLRYIGGCSEIHDVQIVADTPVLGITGCESETACLAIDLPDVSLWLERPADFRERLAPDLNSTPGVV